MAATTTPAKGFECGTCGAEHVFSAYVYAKWDTPLDFNGCACGSTHTILRGRATLLIAGNKAGVAMVPAGEANRGAGIGKRS